MTTLLHTKHVSVLAPNYIPTHTSASHAKPHGMLTSRLFVVKEIPLGSQGRTKPASIIQRIKKNPLCIADRVQSERFPLKWNRYAPHNSEVLMINVIFVIIVVAHFPRVVKADSSLKWILIHFCRTSTRGQELRHTRGKSSSTCGPRARRAKGEENRA